MEAQCQYFAIARLQGQHHGGKLRCILAVLEVVQGRGAVFGDLEGPLVFAAFAHFVKASHDALAGKVDHQVARDGENPGIEAGLAVVLRAAPQDANPDFLKEVFGHFALAGEEHQIAHQAVLVGFDELIEQLRVLALQPARNPSVFTLDLPGGLRGQHDLGFHLEPMDAPARRKVSQHGRISVIFD